MERKIVTKTFRKNGIVRAFLVVNGIVQKMWEQTALAGAGVMIHAMEKGKGKTLRTVRYQKEDLG